MLTDTPFSGPGLNFEQGSSERKGRPGPLPYGVARLAEKYLYTFRQLPPISAQDMWTDLLEGLLLLASIISAMGWRATRRRLAESVRERVDLANSSQVIEEERRMLELVAKGASLSEVLNTLTLAIERISPGSLCTVMLLDEEDHKRLLIASGPSLPAEYLQAVNGLVIGPDVGACGSAAFRNETIVIEDVATDYRFALARDFVLGHGLRSCWSQPIRDSRNNVLGTFAMYHGHVARPRAEELRMARAAAQLAGNAIERIRAERALSETTRRLNLAERVARFGIWETDFGDSVITISEVMAAMLQLPPRKKQLSREEFDALVHPDDLESLRSASDPSNTRDGTFQSEFRVILPGGSIRWMRSQWRSESTEGPHTRVIGAMIDITEEMNTLVATRQARAQAEASARAAREAESLEQDRKAILELVAKDQPLDHIVATMAGAVASHLPGSLCSIRVELNNSSRMSVYPQFPEALARAIEDLEIDSVRQTLIALPVARLSGDTAWLRFLETHFDSAFQFYRAVPILRNNRVTGLIISFFSERGSCPAEEKLLESWGQFASLAVERRGLYEQLSFRAQYDSLTALLNRASLYEHLDEQLARTDAQDRSLALVYLDLDYFKEINDNHGHGAGDKVLQNVASHILKNVRRTDFAARIGGDEFVVVLPGVVDRGEARRIAGLLVGAISQPVLFNGNELRVEASCGLSLYPEDGVQSEALLKAADEDMYKAKMKLRRRGNHRTRAKESVASGALLSA
jgi:diguanylate cyclase (GGDEF)-like protein